LREQTVTPRGARNNRAPAGTRAGGETLNAQQPAPRRGAPLARGTGAANRQSASKSKGGAWRGVRAWLPPTVKIALAVCAGLVLFSGYRAAAASDFFELKAVDVTGTARASDDQIKLIVRQAAAGAGVWKVDLDAVRAEIERQPWVRKAVVSRVLPSGLRVRVTERVPRVVVRTNAGRFVWVDDDAVLVGTLAAGHRQPDFFLRGWDESGTDAARAANRERVAKFLELAREWEAAGMSSRVSEVNLDDLRDVRAQLAGDDSQIEIRLGGAEWTKRLIQALEALEAERQTPRGAHITYIVMVPGPQGVRPVLGFSTGAARAADGDATADQLNASVSDAGAVAPAAGASNETDAGVRKSDAKLEAKSDAKVNVKRDAKAEAARKSSGDAAKRSEALKKSEASKKSEAKRGGGQGEAGERARTRDGAERPRRVGGDTEQL
jgi:cell division septal protein FtsQ